MGAEVHAGGEVEIHCPRRTGATASKGRKHGLDALNKRRVLQLRPLLSPHAGDAVGIALLVHVADLGHGAVSLVAISITIAVVVITGATGCIRIGLTVRLVVVSTVAVIR